MTNYSEMFRLLPILTFILTAISLSLDLLASDETENAITQAQETVAKLELDRGAQDQDLIEPLLSLAGSLFAGGQFQEAENVSRKGQYITHLTDGVLTLEQLPFLDILSEIYLSTNQAVEANRQQEFSYYLNQHQLDADPVKMQAATEKLGKWYLKTGQFHHSRKIMQIHLKNLENGTLTDELQLIEPLRLLAKNNQLKSASSCCGQNSLQRVALILENHPEATVTDQIRAYLDAGDALILNGQASTADAYYKKAWDLSSTNPDSETRFDQPVQIAKADLLSGRSSFSRGHRDTSYLRAGSNPTSFHSSRFLGMRASQLSVYLKNQGYEEDDLDIPPREVWILPDDQSADVIINNLGSSQFNGEKIVAVIGHPFRFIKRQLNQILPGRLKKPENLVEIEISFAFTVNENGNTSDIEMLESNAPSDLYKQVREALQKSQFRPKMVNGIRVSSPNERLTQTFK